MAKSLRCKREKRLRAIKRELVEPYYEKKEAAKLAALEAALAAPKLPPRLPKNSSSNTTELEVSANAAAMDVEMDDDGTQGSMSLKPVGKIGKKLKRRFKLGKGKRTGKGKIRRKNI